MADTHSLFNQITIIGLGLIGSSLARIIRKKGLARRIVGCSNSQETLDKAKAMGIIDAGMLNPADSVKRSELVVLCTPLSTYNTIAAEIALMLKPGCILTDVGSVKQFAIEQITPHLRNGQVFIPAHPIAGSEQSGIDAGNTTLFNGKKLIITPATGFHGKAACDKVTSLWKLCGATVEVLKPEKHDNIYAGMSHAVQMIAYAYAISLKETGTETTMLAQQADEFFRQFTRLSTSDPVMWRDIVLANPTEIGTALSRFTKRLEALVQLLENSAIPQLQKEIAGQVKARTKLKAETIEPVKRSYAQDNNYFSAAVALPVLVASAAMESFTDTDYAGTGFLSLTLPLLNHPSLTDSRLEQHKGKILSGAQVFVKALQILCSLIAEGEREKLEGLFADSVVIGGGIRG
jgi:cyclohexadieny/prephenate dehydrogenase